MGFSCLRLLSAFLRSFLAALVGSSLLLGSGLGELGWQGYAWATMLWERSPEMGLSAALEDTFSGQSPCPHCLAIAQHTQTQEEKREPLAPGSGESLHAFATLLGWNEEQKPQLVVNFREILSPKVGWEEGRLRSLWTIRPAVPPPRSGA